MNFNLDPSKQAQEVFFSCKLQKLSHSSIYFNNNGIEYVSSQKHLEMILDTEINFQEHIKKILTKVNKTIGLLRKLQNILPRGLLLTIFKLLFKPYLVIYDQNCNNTFHQKMESVQDNAALSITGAIRSSSGEKLYQKLGFKSLQQR